MKSRLLLSAATACIALAGLALGACHNDKSAQGAGAMTCYNKTCCCGKPSDSHYTSTYRGETLSFCSKQCKDIWDKMSESDRAAKFAQMKKGM